MSSPRPGAQLLHRAADVLRTVSAVGQAGLSTADIGERTGLSRSTAHRILQALEEEGFVDRDETSGLWFLGPEIYVLGGIAGHRFDVTQVARDILHNLAHETGESAFLSVRRGDETVCLLREEGSFPLRSFVLYEGVRFPLGVASAGLVLLSFQSDDEITDYLKRARLRSAYGNSHSNEALWQRIRQTRKRGYSVNPGLVVEGSWGMAATVFSRSGEPTWALSLTGVESRFVLSRQPVLGRMLLQSAHQLSLSLGYDPATAPHRLPGA